MKLYSRMLCLKETLDYLEETLSDDDALNHQMKVLVKTMPWKLKGGRLMMVAG